MNIGEAARAMNIVFEAAQKLAAGPAVQAVLRGALIHATDDTFALRLLNYTEKRDRNKILLDFKNVNLDDLKPTAVYQLINIDVSFQSRYLLTPLMFDPFLFNSYLPG